MDESTLPTLEQVEGRNPVIEALKGPRKVKSILLAAKAGRSASIEEILSLAGEHGVPVEEVPREKIREISATDSPQGVVASVSPYRYFETAEILESVEDGETPFLLALDGIEDPHNFGALLRVACAAGLHGVVTTRRRSCPLTPAAAKASAGAVEHVRIARVPNLPSALNALKDKGLWVAGAEAGKGSLYTETDLSIPLVLVLGGEGKGLSRLVGERCDLLVRLPMPGAVSSLNVSTAGAVLIYEVLRQRTEAAREAGKDQNRR